MLVLGRRLTKFAALSLIFSSSLNFNAFLNGVIPAFHARQLEHRLLLVLL